MKRKNINPKSAFIVAPEKSKQFLEYIKTMPTLKESLEKMNELFKKSGIYNKSLEREN